jgi:predicted nuclease of predicted toxin-antitoxin system
MIKTEFGVPARHAADLRMQNASDRALWEFALKQDYILVSGDEDFAKIVPIKPGPDCCG